MQAEWSMAGDVRQALPQFAVSEFTTWHQSFEEDVALYARLGVAMEICERKVERDPASAREQLARVRAARVKVTSVQPRVHALFKDTMCPELDDPAERMRRFRDTIDLFGAAFEGENLPLVTIGGAAPGYDFRRAHRAARRHYRELADYAADRGVRVMYEPLSPVLMNVDTFTCTLDEALRLIEDVDRPKTFGLMLDVWHVWREPEIARRVQAAAGRVFGIHVSDWPRGEPRHYADRVLPGDGIIDLPGLFGALEAGGYRGAYCLEIFSKDEFADSLWREDPAAVIARGQTGFAAAWRARRGPDER